MLVRGEGKLHYGSRVLCGALVLVAAHQARSQITSDLGTGAAIDRFVYIDSVPNPFPLTTHSIPSNAFSAADHSVVSVFDDSRDGATTFGGENRASVRFVPEIAEQPIHIAQLDVPWEGRGPVGASTWNALALGCEGVGSSSGAPTPDAAKRLTVLVTNGGSDEGVLTDQIETSTKRVECFTNIECNDFDRCTIDICNSGLCSNNAVDCSDVGDQCNVASCDQLGEDGNCDTMVRVTNGTACDDGLTCNVGETCQSGVCVGGGSPDCSGTGDDCNADNLCDPAGAEGNCDTPGGAINLGLPCDDGAFCTLTDICIFGPLLRGDGTPGLCIGIGQTCPGQGCDEVNDRCFECLLDTDCDDGNDCTLDTCITFACENLQATDGLACDDGNVCNINETCQSGTCVSGVPVDCTGVGNLCIVSSCDIGGLEGNCDTITPVTDGTDCSDGNVCNGTESCESGFCFQGISLDCDDGLACTDDSCDPSQGCEHLSNCPVGETCVQVTGTCLGACPDCSVLDDPCNVGVCNVATIQCEVQSINEGGACDNGLACTVNNTCVAGSCVGNLKDCSMWDDACNVGVCDIVTEDCLAQPVTDGITCDDGVDCTFDDVCQFGVCEGSDGDCVSSAPDCQVGSCNHTTGLCEFLDLPDGSSCDDGDECTAVDVCDTGACLGGAVPPPPIGTGCVDTELMVRVGQEMIGIGQVVEVDIVVRNNSCPPSAIDFACGITLDQQISAIRLPVTWNPNVFELLGVVDPCDGTQRTCAGGPNEGVVCSSDVICEPGGVCECTDSTCGVPNRYDWILSGFVNDCNAQGDGINFPCNGGVPGNDGTALFEAAAQVECAACLARNVPLTVSTLRFKALATALEPEEIRIETCLQQTRSKVIGAVNGDAGDVTGTMGTPALITVGSSCLPPFVEVRGPRYIAITPADGPDLVALQITGVDPAITCVSGYVSDSGLHGASATFLSPTEWATVLARGTGLVSGMTYEVRADCDPDNPGTNLSSPVTVTLWEWADNDHDNAISILDITRSIDMFRGDLYLPRVPCATDSDCSTEPPNFVCDESVGLCLQVSLDNIDIVGVGCLPDATVSILDITQIVDAFRALPDPCTGNCQ